MPDKIHDHVLGIRVYTLGKIIYPSKHIVNGSVWRYLDSNIVAVNRNSINDTIDNTINIVR